jgi:hypothetical protein
MRKRTLQDDQGFESPLDKAVRKMIAQRMNVSRAFVTSDGSLVHAVNGYLLTTEQIVELDSKNELTSWGVREYALRFDEERRKSRSIGVRSLTLCASFCYYFCY